MTIFHNFTQENYNSLKLFLISKYNIRFLPGEKENTHEHLEVKDNTTTADITFYKDDKLEIVCSNEESQIYKEIIEKIHQISPNSSNSREHEEKNSNSHDESFDAVMKLFQHISECNICKEKLRMIFEHAK